MFGWVANLFRGRRAELSGRTQSLDRQVRAAYDVAQTTDDNTRHWSNSDGLSAKAALDPETRRRVRQRARYEALENNCYAKGIVLTLANDTIGTGPRLQLRTPDRDVNNQIEMRFGEWADRVCLAEKLRLMRISKAVDGEVFAVLFTNPRLPGIKLDLSPSEADHFQSPAAAKWEVLVSDGIEYDSNGYPAAYYRLKQHPGGDLSWLSPLDYERLDARYVVHLYRCERPGQIRGVSEIVSALPLFAMLRRFTLATIAAAETAADFAAIMKTSGAAVADPDDVEALDAIPIEKRALLTLPKGWDINQLRAEHPATTYEMFKREIIQEMARCLNMPFNVAAGDSSSYNYSSGRLDHQTYFKSIRVERSYFESACLDRIFAEWLREAATIPGFLPDDMREQIAAGLLPQHDWFWDGFEHVDPTKEASAAIMLRDAGLLTESEYWASQGHDWERQHEQLERERLSREERGLNTMKAANPEPAQEESLDDGDQKPARKAA